MNSCNSFLVGGSTYVLGTDVGPYPFGTKWISPDVSIAKSAIIKCIENPVYAKSIMTNAVSSSMEQLSAQCIGSTISPLLAKLKSI